MTDPRKESFATTAQTLIKNLEKNKMDGYFCEDSNKAVELVKELVPEGSSIGWGGSVTFAETGAKAALEQGNYNMLDRAKATDAKQAEEMIQKHLSCDTFFMSTNAITIKGELVNIDGNSNRLACLLYGPKQVIVLVGMNKLVKDIDDAINRIHTLACPPNATRLHCDTPCANIGICGNCHNDDCMCCNIVITRHNRHKGRIKVILIAEDLGFQVRTVMEYTLKSGKKLTEEDIASLNEAIENGNLSVLGKQGETVEGKQSPCISYREQDSKNG